MSWGRPETLVDHIGVKLLMPLTWPYKLLFGLQQLVYKKNGFSFHKLSQPVISIGNLTVGGTGKTPIIVDLASRLLTQNIKVGILSRGYKRSKSQSCTVVSDGQGNFASIEESGDEPLMMAKMLPQAVVIVNQDRFVAGQKAIKDYNCEVLLLDDGFQHWRLQRDSDIVLLDYENPPWNDSLLPAGRLREPLSALKRATHVIITKIPTQSEPAKIQQFDDLINKYAPNCQINVCQFEPSSIHQQIAGKWTEVSIDKLRDLPIVAFCGIAQPNGFFNLLKQLNAKVLHQVAFSDHQYYSKQDIKKLEKQLWETSAEYLVTTRKDLVKLENSSISSRLMALNLKTVWASEPLDIISLVKQPLAQTKGA
jgi:tetraacyldisaccharide 4'-kinase